MGESVLSDVPRCRVLVLGSYGPSLEVFRGALITEIVKLGCEVHAMAADIDKSTAASLTARGAITHPLDFSRTGLNPMSMIALLVSLARRFRRIKPDVVIAYTIKPVVFGAFANRRARFVAIITGLGYAFTAGTQPRRRLIALAARLLYRLALRRADAILFQNPDDHAHFRALGLLAAAANVGVIAGSGVELDRFAPVPLPSNPSFLMASRLLGDKGVREFAAASVGVLRTCPLANVVLAGFFDGSPDCLRAAELETMVNDGIEYLGHLNDVRPALANCGIYVLPSYREGTPRSVLEAMAMGRAIITTDAPGCRETVINGRNGLLVAPRDAAALERAMLTLARDPGRVAQMGIESRRIAEEKYDVNKVNAMILHFSGLR